jgi:excisionase family DNA binding protein
MHATHQGDQAAQTLTIALPDQLAEAIAQRAAVLVLEHLRKTSSEDSPLMTIPEAAAYLRCKRQRIDDLLSARRLTRHKDGRRTLISRSELENHVSATTGRRRAGNGDSIFPGKRATVTNPDNKRS